MSSEEEHILHPKWRSRYTILALVVSIVVGIVAFIQTAGHILAMVRNGLPFSIARLLPGSDAAKFDEGALAAYTNEYITDNRLEYFFGPPFSKATVDSIDSIRFKSPYGNIYVQRNGQQTKAIVIVSGEGHFPSSISDMLTEANIPIEGIAFKDALGRWPQGEAYAVLKIRSRSLLFISGFERKVGTYYIGYAYPEGIICKGSESIPYIGVEIFQGPLRECSFSHRSSARAFALAKTFEDGNPQTFSAAIRGAASLIPMWGLGEW